MDASVAPVATDDGARVRAVVVAPADESSGGTPSGGPPFGGTAPGPTSSDTETATTDLTLIPYHRWAEHGPATMRIFLPTR